jgi:hypothetical protein
MADESGEQRDMGIQLDLACRDEISNLTEGRKRETDLDNR